MATFSTLVPVLVRLIILPQSYVIDLISVIILLLLKYGWFSLSKNHKKTASISPGTHFLLLKLVFFGFLDSFYIKNELRYFFANTRRSKIKWLSKVPQICPNFWLMTSYQKMGWFWDDETSFFELSGQFYIKIHLFHQESAIIFVIINPFLSGTRYWKITEICKSAPGDVIRACTLLHNEICVLKTLFKHPTSNGHNSAKKQYFLMRFFLLASYD